MIAAADSVIPARQVLATGRISDAVSSRALSEYQVSIGCRIAGIDRKLPVSVGFRGGGWFTAHCLATVLPPGLAEEATVDLVSHVTAKGHSPGTLVRSVPGSHFALQDIQANPPGGHLVRAWSGGPIDFSLGLAPMAVALRGILIYGHDPARPVPGASVQVAGVPAATSGPDGRFFIPELPLVQMAELDIQDGAHAHTLHWSVDYSKPVNEAILSLPNQNVENQNA